MEADFWKQIPKYSFCNIFQNLQDLRTFAPEFQILRLFKTSARFLAKLNSTNLIKREEKYFCYTVKIYTDFRISQHYQIFGVQREWYSLWKIHAYWLLAHASKNTRPFSINFNLLSLRTRARAEMFLRPSHRRLKKNIRLWSPRLKPRRLRRYTETTFSTLSGSNGSTASMAFSPADRIAQAAQKNMIKEATA